LIVNRYSTVPFPVPLLPAETLSQPALLAVVHLQVPDVITLTEPAPSLAPTWSALRESAYVHPA